MSIKKTVTRAIAIAITSSTMAIMPCQATSMCTLGDITFDGVVDNVDCEALRRYLIGLQSLTDEQKTIADLHQDGEIDVRDLLALEKVSCNRITTGAIVAGAEGTMILNKSSVLSYNHTQDGLEAFVDNSVLNMSAVLSSDSVSVDFHKTLGEDFYSIGGTIDDSGVLLHSTKTLGDNSSSLIEVRKGILFTGVKMIDSETGTTVQATKGGFCINDQQIVDYNKDSELVSILVKGLGESFKVDDVEVKQDSKGRITFNDGEQCSIESLANVRICYFGGQFLRMEKKGDTVTINGVSSLRECVPCEVEQFTILREDVDDFTIFRFYDSIIEKVYELTVDKDFELLSFRKLSNPSVKSIKVVKIQPVGNNLKCSVEYYDYNYKVSKFCSEYSLAADYSYSGCYDFKKQVMNAKSISKPLGDGVYCTYYSKAPEGESYGLINKDSGLKEFLVTYGDNVIEASINEGKMLTTLREDDNITTMQNIVDDYGSVIKYDKNTNKSVVIAQSSGKDLYSANLDYLKIYES